MSQRFTVLTKNRYGVRDTAEHNNIHLQSPFEANAVCAMLNILNDAGELTAKLEEQTQIIYHQAQRLLELTELLEIEEDKNKKLAAKIKEHKKVIPPLVRTEAKPISKYYNNINSKSGAPTWQN